MPSLVLLIGTGAYIWVIAHDYHNSDHRWAAITAVLTGGAFIVAVIGLPFALYQLAALDRDVKRPRELQRELNKYRVEGGFLLHHVREPDREVITARASSSGEPDTEAAKRVEEFRHRLAELEHQWDEWMDSVRKFIEDDLGDPQHALYQGLLLLGDANKPLSDRIADQLAYIETTLIPKVKEGYL